MLLNVLLVNKERIQEHRDRRDGLTVEKSGIGCAGLDEVQMAFIWEDGMQCADRLPALCACCVSLAMMVEHERQFGLPPFLSLFFFFFFSESGVGRRFLLFCAFSLFWFLFSECTHTLSLVTAALPLFGASEPASLRSSSSSSSAASYTLAASSFGIHLDTVTITTGVAITIDTTIAITIQPVGPSSEAESVK